MTQERETKERQNKWIRPGDKVIVIAGNQRKQIGTVLSRTEDRAVVQGVNLRKKHQRPTQENPKGSIVQIEAAIHVSNLRHCPNPNQAVKVRLKQEEEGKVLYYRDGEKEVRLRSIKKTESQ